MTSVSGFCCLDFPKVMGGEKEGRFTVLGSEGWMGVHRSMEAGRVRGQSPVCGVLC